MDKEELRAKIYSKVEELPTLPAVLPRLMHLMDDETANASRVADVIEGDPALTSKILKAANSAYYGFPQEIDTLKQTDDLVRLLEVDAPGSRFGPQVGHCIETNDVGPSTYVEQQDLDVGKSSSSVPVSARPGTGT
jgi:hypothetical protein